MAPHRTTVRLAHAALLPPLPMNCILAAALLPSAADSVHLPPMYEVHKSLLSLVQYRMYQMYYIPGLVYVSPAQATGQPALDETIHGLRHYLPPRASLRCRVYVG